MSQKHENNSDSVNKEKMFNEFEKFNIKSSMEFPWNFVKSSMEDFIKLEITEKEIFFLHVNIDGLQRNFLKLKNFIEKCPRLPDVICVTEVSQ